MNKHTWKIYGLWILLSEAVGGLSGWLTRDGAKIYSQSIVQPPLSPPPLVFPIVWAILFALMGIGAARVFLAPASAARTRGLRLFFVQLGSNFLWSILFFCLQAFGFALIWLVVLWVLILWMLFTFLQADRAAGFLHIPYLLWVTFAAYLNLGVWILN